MFNTGLILTPCPPEEDLQLLLFFNAELFVFFFEKFKWLWLWVLNSNEETEREMNGSDFDLCFRRARGGAWGLGVGAEPVELLRERNWRERTCRTRPWPLPALFRLLLRRKCQKCFAGGEFSSSDSGVADRNSFSIFRFSSEFERRGGILGAGEAAGSFLISTGRIWPLAKSSSAERVWWPAVVQKWKSKSMVGSKRKGSSAGTMWSESWRSWEKEILGLAVELEASEHTSTAMAGGVGEIGKW